MSKEQSDVESAHEHLQRIHRQILERDGGQIPEWLLTASDNAMMRQLELEARELRVISEQYERDGNYSDAHRTQQTALVLEDLLQSCRELENEGY